MARASGERLDTGQYWAIDEPGDMDRPRQAHPRSPNSGAPFFFGHEPSGLYVLRMVRRWRGWNRLGAALTALILTVFAFGPALDILACRDAAGAVASLQSIVAEADHGSADHSHDAGDACAHGHCHHGGGSMPALPAAAEGPARLTAIAQTPPRARVPTADLQFGLMRPPRA